MTAASMLRVVIVDDEAAIREALHELLLEEGMDVVGIASNGLEGVTLALALHPDVVVMDMRMPVMDGIAATRRIKEEQPAMRVVVMTAYDDSSLRKSAAVAGADAYVVKGTASGTLMASLTALSPDPTVDVAS